MSSYLIFVTAHCSISLQFVNSMDPSARILGAFLYVCWLVSYLLASYLNHKMTLFISWMFFLFGSAAMVRIRPNPKCLKRKRIFLTSCDVNYGSSLVQFLCDLKVTVFAGCSDPSAPELQDLKKRYSKYLHLFKLDVTSEIDIEKAYKYIDENLGDKCK